MSTAKTRETQPIPAEYETGSSVKMTDGQLENGDESRAMLQKLENIFEGRCESKFEYYPIHGGVEYRPLATTDADSDDEEKAKRKEEGEDTADEEDEKESDGDDEKLDQERWPVRVEYNEMEWEMQEEAVTTALEVIQADMSPCAVAGALKRHFEKRYGDTWHCIVGKDFASYVSYEPFTYIYFYMRSTGILLFKTHP